MMTPDKEGETTWYNFPSEVGVFRDLSQTNKKKKFDVLITTCNDPEILLYVKIRSRDSEKAVLSNTMGLIKRCKPVLRTNSFK